LSLYSLSAVLAVVSLAGCGSAATPISAPGAVPQNATGTTQLARNRSWMLPKAKSEDLLYVSNYFNGRVNVYSYRTRRLVGQLSGLNGPGGECSDKSGDVFIANVKGASIVEYGHGGTSPIATFDDSGYYPNDCSVDPATGDLAVANLDGIPLPGNLAIFRSASTPPTFYEDHNPYIAYYYFCGYDASGNVVVDAGSDGGGPLVFDELPAGGTNLNRVHLPPGARYGGTLQWDGTFMTEGDGGNRIYRFSVGQRRRAYRHGRTFLQGSPGVSQIWIGNRTSGQQAVGVANNANEVLFWDYPTGRLLHVITTGFDDPDGVTVSVVERR
jgi:hypothetical protein